LAPEQATRPQVGGGGPLMGGPLKRGPQMGWPLKRRSQMGGPLKGGPPMQGGSLANCVSLIVIGL